MVLRLYFVLLLFITPFNFHVVVVCMPSLNGRYTRNIDNFKLVVPFKVTDTGNFSSFRVSSLFKQDYTKNREKRSAADQSKVYYMVILDGKKHLAELWPNHALLSPDAVSEKRRPKRKVQDRRIEKIDIDAMCHYAGQIDGEADSKVALSTCDGLAGYITVYGKRYFIEPVQNHVANENGQHLHVVYERSPRENEIRTSRCGTTSNWEEAWKKRFLRKYKKGDNDYVGKRSLLSVHRYLETLIVCDKKFLHYHRNIDVEAYVLTIMNMVADFYHDSSSGHQMDVVVVRIIYLDKEEEEIDLVINPDADATLASFCKWQEKINPKDISNPNHHDIAVLLTRYDICADNMANCGLMGLAYVATACTSNKPCAINEDGGLVLSIVVAHEMGHVMGSAHDQEGDSKCSAQDKDESFFVMAPYVHMFTTRWSTCSRGFLNALFDNGLGECLNDEPAISLYKSADVLPGIVYDGEQQCKLLLPNATLCPFELDKICEVLMCQIAPMQCTTKQEPAADGTNCGENMWCYRKKCVRAGQRPEAINGGWGKWSSYSSCSRTCGGGVKISSRECDNPVPQHRGRYCLGDRKKIKTCNMDPCPSGSPSFREVQCEERNSKPFRGKMYNWKAFLKEDDPCVLYCLNNENVFAKLEPRVKDGTKCKPGTQDMCISGVCKKVGCDGEIDSNAVEDVCGICGGDGTGCKVIEDSYTAAPGRDYTKITKFVTGCRNVHVEELAPSTNTLAVSDPSGRKFYLNPDHTEQQDGAIHFGNVEGIYTHVEPNREKLVIHGPLTEDLILYVVFYEQENVGYKYKYSVSAPGSVRVPKYDWEQVNWEECSVRCGGGEQAAKFSCVEEKAGKVSDSFCESLPSPEKKSRVCNQQKCRTKWKVGKWGKCHACKFKSGVRIREVECIKETSHVGADDILVEDSECKQSKPGTRELCNSHKKCKSKRDTDGLPDELMEDVWRQIRSVQNLEKPSSDESRVREEEKICQTEAENKGGIKLQVGKIVHDRIPPEEIKVIEVPLKQSHLSLNLSDSVFETMGDQMGDSLDISKAKITTGEAAAKILENMQKEEKEKQEEH